MVLSEIRNNGSYRVKRLHDCSGETHHHLENLGFIPGEMITVVSRIGACAAYHGIAACKK